MDARLLDPPVDSSVRCAGLPFTLAYELGRRVTGAMLRLLGARDAVDPRLLRGTLLLEILRFRPEVVPSSISGVPITTHSSLSVCRLLFGGLSWTADGK